MAKESTFGNMVITLFVVCLVASAGVGGIYALTKDLIDAAKIAKVNSAISGVVPDFDNDPSSEKFEVTTDGKTSMVYPAKKDGEIVGYAIAAATSKGFGGAIVLMVGFEPDGTIYNTAVISHTETPGLGDKIDVKKSDFSVQFNGKNTTIGCILNTVKKDGGDVDAITASTISSRAFCDAVETAYKTFKDIQQK